MDYKTWFAIEKPIENKITCDGCERSLNRASNSIDYRLKLSNEKIPCDGGAVTDMMIYPIIERTAYFCGLGCLRKWLTSNVD